MIGRCGSRLPGTFRRSYTSDLTEESFDLRLIGGQCPCVIHDVIACLFGRFMHCQWLVSVVVLLCRPPLVGKFRTICTFSTGQPLGYYGSWALFSLSHHYMVWLAAVDRGSPFTDYAGDDIVIAHKAVAQQSRELLNKLDLSISEAKSIQSQTGALEFAKQLWVDRVQVNLTPVSPKELLGETTLIGLCQLADKYGLSRTSRGAGYRVRARLLSNHLSLWWKQGREVLDLYSTTSRFVAWSGQPLSKGHHS